jgi:hypothetical protein
MAPMLKPWCSICQNRHWPAEGHIKSTPTTEIPEEIIKPVEIPTKCTVCSEKHLATNAERQRKWKAAHLDEARARNRECKRKSRSKTSE